VVELDDLPFGVPNFLKAFFESRKTDYKVVQITPGTDTLQ